MNTFIFIKFPIQCLYNTDNDRVCVKKTLDKNLATV